MKFFLVIAGILLLGLSACYEPKQGCLDILATNYDVSADDPCPDCCTFPTWTVAFQHVVILPSEPDTFFSFRYNTPYPSPFDTLHYFSVERCHYFLSNFRLVNAQGEMQGISDSIAFEAPKGTPVRVENNFAKIDRDIFQPSVLGKFLAQGLFHQLRFTLGLNEPLLQTDPESVPKTHPLSIAGDSLIYEAETGYIPYTLIFKTDTLPESQPLVFRFFEPREIALDLPQPFELERGFNVKLTLKINYLAWFEGIDLQNDSYQTIQQKLEDNLTKAFTVNEIVME